MEQGQSALTAPKEVSGATKVQILLGYGETVIGGTEGLQALSGVAASVV